MKSHFRAKNTQVHITQKSQTLRWLQWLNWLCILSLGVGIMFYVWEVGAAGISGRPEGWTVAIVTKICSPLLLQCGSSAMTRDYISGPPLQINTTNWLWSYWWIMSRGLFTTSKSGPQTVGMRSSYSPSLSCQLERRYDYNPAAMTLLRKIPEESGATRWKEFGSWMTSSHLPTYTTPFFFNKQLILEFFYYINLVFILTSSVYLLNKY